MNFQLNTRSRANQGASRKSFWGMGYWQLGVLAMIALVAAALGYSTMVRAGQAAGGPPPGTPPPDSIQWINHFDLLSGDPSVTFTSSNSTTSGVGGGLTGVVVTSNTLGNTDSYGGNKVVQMAVEELPVNLRIDGVRLCYELSAGSTSFIDQIRLAQVQNPPSTALVLLDDPTAQSAIGPVCVNSAAPSSPIHEQAGSVLLSFRINTNNLSDKICIRAVGLWVNPM